MHQMRRVFFCGKKDRIFLNSLLPTEICHKRLSVWKKVNFIKLENLGHLLNEKSIGPNHIFQLKIWRKFTSSKIGEDVAKFGMKTRFETLK